jgi:hypothetical protein
MDRINLPLMNPSIETLTTCPVCKNDQTHFVLRIKDHSVSGEFFDVFECGQCSLRFTKDAPPDEKMGAYYQSED